MVASGTRQGTENLNAWLEDHKDDTWDGFEVSALSQEAVGALDDKERDLTDLVGVALGYDIAYSVDEVLDVIFFADPFEFNQGDIIEYERELVEGSEKCFVEKECDTLSYITSALGSYPLGLEVRSKTMNQYRWVSTDLGDVAVQRTWMMEPAEASWDSINLDSSTTWWPTCPPRRECVEWKPAGWSLLLATFRCPRTSRSIWQSVLWQPSKTKWKPGKRTTLRPKASKALGFTQFFTKLHRDVTPVDQIRLRFLV